MQKPSKKKIIIITCLVVIFSIIPVEKELDLNKYYYIYYKAWLSTYHIVHKQIYISIELNLMNQLHVIIQILIQM